MLTNKEMKRLVLASLVVVVAGGAQAQGLGNSPYSRIGLGEYNANTGGVRQMGMGGVGLAAPNSVNVNELNPALLYYTGRTTFEAGYNGQYKTVKNASASSRSGNGTLGYFALSVPLSTKWGAAVGLKPVSAVDYESNIVKDVANTPTGQPAQSLTQLKGTGGVSEAYLAQGVRITKAFTLGFTASYVFGVVDETAGTTVVVANSTNSLQKAVDRAHTRYSDFAFRAGAHYRQKLGKSLNVNLGGVYSFAHNLNGQQTITKETEDTNGTLISTATTVSDGRGRTFVPALSQLGVSFDNDKNWSLNLDVAQQQWSKYRSFDGTGPGLSNTLRFGLGGEITPDPGSVEHYFQRVAYRAGISLAQLPYQPGGKMLYDRSVSWGFGFPLPTATPLEATTISLAFTYGVRGNTELLGGTTGSSNVQENYIRGQLGVTLNNRWFIKRRLQ
ncbi:outer membrane protein transport protein [Hymenobacter siberiensis]|uniref:outer membrane protein transport protein n=1 Tax=Hymenobacter siberiensis TaxID=2848396 RepID=UPI001C1E77A6|nr:outer membrane protein transport protein [Hymenobacter siberiensis]MBU6119790.1 outer membrane protein transport protein [Hymenobacter siberiensis]